MPKPHEPEIIPPESQHAYDDPDIDPKGFLLAVMHDKRLPVTTRMEAATKVSVYIYPRLAQVDQEINAGVRIRIEGGLPPLPGTSVIMPENQADKKTGT
jgi:hypothetical protein